MRQQHGWQPARASSGAIQAAGDEVPWQALEEHAVHGVSVARDPAMRDRIERRGLGHWPESQRDLDLPPDDTRASGPRFGRGGRREREVVTQ